MQFASGHPELGFAMVLCRYRSCRIAATVAQQNNRDPCGARLFESFWMVGADQSFAAAVRALRIMLFTVSDGLAPTASHLSASARSIASRSTSQRTAALP